MGGNNRFGRGEFSSRFQAFWLSFHFSRENNEQHRMKMLEIYILARNLSSLAEFEIAKRNTPVMDERLPRSTSKR